MAALSSFDIDKKYSLLQPIGKGSAGSVYLCKSKRDHKNYALKQIFLDKRKKSRNKEVVLREVLILQKLCHPHVVRYHEAFFDRKQDNLCIIQDYCGGGSLHEKVNHSKQNRIMIAERQVMEWFIQVTMALRYIHGKRVLHRDLKTQNVFLTKTNMIKIGDFGIARVLEHTVDMASTCVGTPCYLSPEICQDKPYNSKSDIWALGCLLYELCAQKPAFNASNLVSLCYKIVKGKYEDIPNQYSNLVKMLISKSLNKLPEDRPTATSILNLPEVKNQLSVYITDKETEFEKIKSAHPEKRAPAAAAVITKGKRRPARTSVVNIGEKKLTKKKSSTSPNGSGKTGKKKKKKVVNKTEADEVKQLPDEVINHRPVAPGRVQDPFKVPSSELPPILRHSGIVGYSPPTVRREPEPSVSPRSYSGKDQSTFLKDFSTETSQVPLPPQPPPTPPSAPPPGPPSGPIRSVTHTVEPRHSLLMRAPKPNTPPRYGAPGSYTPPKPYPPPKPFTPPQYHPPTFIETDGQRPPVNSSTFGAKPSPSKPVSTLSNLQEEEVRKSLDISQLQVSLTSPLVQDSVLHREEQGNITPLPLIAPRPDTPPFEHEPPPTPPTHYTPPDDHPSPGPHRDDYYAKNYLPPSPDISESTCTQESTIVIPFRVPLLPEDNQLTLMQGQVDVNWLVGTQGFTPELRPASNQPAAAVFVHREHSDVHYIENNANTCTPSSVIYLTEVPEVPEIDDFLDLSIEEDKEDEISKEDEDPSDKEFSDYEGYDYSDDFEEEIPDYEDIQDIPDLTAPGPCQEEEAGDSDEENDAQFELAMKSARVALDNIEEEEDEEFVEDFVMPSSAGNIAALRQYCVSMLGEDLFRAVQRKCAEFEDNYDSHDTFLKKLEQLAGPEKVEICLIVDEFFVED